MTSTQTCPAMRARHQLLVVSAEYEIDLKDENASAFHAALDYCITHSRWPGGGERRSFRGSIRA
ncbi:hypothetical protein ACH47B_32595 [Rhodococcus sp. NPDC019627]